MKNILVTGGAGYIGSHIVELLIKKKFNVFIIDNLSTGYRKLINKKAKFFNIDINEFSKVRKVIEESKVDSVIHLAAKTNVAEAEKKPKLYHANNITGTLNLIKACNSSHVKNFIFSSTCAVYDSKLRFVKETSKTMPKGVYGITKLKAEKIIKKYFNNKKINYAILRYFNVVGASPSKKIGQINKDDQLFKNLSLATMRKNPVFNIYGNDYDTFDGTCVRDFIHVCDLADIHIQTLLKLNIISKSVVLNCGYGKGLSVFQVINEFRNFSKKSVEINFKNRRNDDIVEMVSNTKKLKKFLKWKPKFDDLKKMVKSSIYWEKKLVRTN